MRSIRRVLGAVGSIALIAVALSLRSSDTAGGAAVRPLGLVQAGNSKTTCITVHLSHYDLNSSMAPAEASTGIKFNCLETFSASDSNWNAWVNPWETRPGYGYVSWLSQDPLHRTVVLTQNLVPDDVARTPNWRGQCASGAYRRYDRQLAALLIAKGFEYSVIRLAHEMNGTWYGDAIGPTPADWHLWARCFAVTVAAMRTVPGGHFLFDWNVNAGYQDIPLHDYYPGNNFVDIIGIDAYDSSGTVKLPPISSPRRWPVLTSEPLGLDALEHFARAHHKALSIPEWGSVARPQGGDDGAYVADMGAFVATHDVAYQSWFDPGGSSILPLDPGSPRSLASYVAAFGSKSAIARFQARFTKT